MGQAPWSVGKPTTAGSYLGVDLSYKTGGTTMTVGRPVYTGGINSGYPDSWLKYYSAELWEKFIVKQETKFDKAVRAAKASMSDPRHGDTYSYQDLTITFLEGGWTYPPAISKKEDPDGPLIPLSTKKSVPNRVIAPVNHDFVAALYKPYVSPI